VRDVRALRFGGPRPSRSLGDVLTPDHAIALATRHQRRAIRDAAAFAAALDEPVGFLCRRGPDGTVFEAVALASARTCAVIDAEGALRHIAGGAPRDPWTRADPSGAAVAERTRVRRVAERALAATARPRGALSAAAPARPRPSARRGRPARARSRARGAPR
jgi:hypothetical protein